MLFKVEKAREVESREGIRIEFVKQLCFQLGNKYL